jgi:hypothetical protein
MVPESIITVGRVCNMLGEIAKRRDDLLTAMGHYLRGLESEPIGYSDNYIDLAELVQYLGQSEVHTIILTFAKVLNQINEGNISMDA